MSDLPKPPAVRFQQFRNWVSLSGVVVAVGSLFAFVFLFAIDLFSRNGNPYLGLLTWLVSPMFFVLGMILMGLGAWIRRRRIRAGAVPHALVIDLSRRHDKRALAGFLAGSVVFLLVTALGSYNTYHYTESVQFCGTACHVPMKPEYTAYLNSAHARVACTECHVGPGAAWYVKSKINGLHQLYGVITDSYHRPIKPPVKNLRPAQETCEQCHWPKKFVGTLDRTYTHFLSDATNTPFTIRLLLKVGGGDPSHGPAGGIHWHMNLANKIEYIATDEKRQIIPWVRATAKDGTVTEYRVKSFKDNPGAHALRTMDCMDCHNRPAHDFRTPNDAVELSMSLGRIDPAMLWVKSNAVAALSRTYATSDEASTKIDTALRTAYNKSPKVDALVAEVQQIYRQNFFPEMKSDWRAYPDNLGHKNWAGCFRCHDGLHKTEDGKRNIEATTCDACHTIIAQGSGAQLETLNLKGLNFVHIDAEMSEFSCNNCHNGGAIP